MGLVYKNILIFVVYTVRNVWWQNLKEHFRTICKTERSGAGGSSKDSTASNWQFYREMSFMKQYFISRRYVQRNIMLIQGS